MLPVTGITVCIVNILIYSFCNGDVSDMFDDFYQGNNQFRERNTGQTDQFHMQFVMFAVKKWTHAINTNLYGVVIQLWWICMFTIWLY